MKILVLNGPNLNVLGRRDHKQYGQMPLEKILELLRNEAKKSDCELVCFQSNHEGELIDCIQENFGKIDGILINPGALSHYGFALRDAIADANVPTIEVHLSDIFNRDDFRKQVVLKDVVLRILVGKKEQSYLEGLKELIIHIRKHP